MFMEKRAGFYARWAACAVFAGMGAAFLLFAAGYFLEQGKESPAESAEAAAYSDTGVTYEGLYAAFSEVWAKREEIERLNSLYDSDTSLCDGEMTCAMEDMPQDAPSVGVEGGSADFGKTNQQEAEVEEADSLKNDGRYLYRLSVADDFYKYTYRFLQIADTKGGLEIIHTWKEAEGERIRDFYVWKDTLVLISQAELSAKRQPEQALGDRKYFIIDAYDIKDRSNPQKGRRFTVKGSYKGSRISDGYLYLWGECETARPEALSDYGMYLPEADGEPFALDKIFLPPNSSPASYFILASMDMERLDGFTDTKAMAASGSHYYVSGQNIYIMEGKSAEKCWEEETDNASLWGGNAQSLDGLSRRWAQAAPGYRRYSNCTDIYRYSYQKGQIEKQAVGRVKGALTEDLAVSEYQGSLRIVTEVKTKYRKEEAEAKANKFQDGLLGRQEGKLMGKAPKGYKSSALYVLDEDLRVTGRIEDIAKGESLHGVRFLGELGFLVTFREVDPLFSVDLSNPWNPKILGELKVSGFSDYLHDCGDGLLLGIGKEVDAEGREECLKVSLFDVSNLSDIKEKSRILLDDSYFWTEALDDYKSVLADVDKNLYGFAMEGIVSGKGGEDIYQLFSIEDGKLRRGDSFFCEDDIGEGNSIWDLGDMRGTYIDDRFFLSYASGRMEEYRLADGQKAGEAVPDWEKYGIEKVFQ